MTTEELIARLARREARALALVPEIEIQTLVATPRVRVTRRPCPWCDAVAPAGKLRPVSDNPAFPVLTLLTCEIVGLRSLLSLDLLGHPARVVSRAVFWAAAPTPVATRTHVRQDRPGRRAGHAGEPALRDGAPRSCRRPA
jgi:hypothetical protein